MNAKLTLLALAAVLFGCDPEPATNDTSDPDTDTDTDTEDTGDTGLESYCGDGIVDQGEQCDEGLDNGPEGACSDTCTWNDWVTCDMLSGPIYQLDTALPQPDGSYHINGRFDGLVAVTSSCVSGATDNVVVEFVVPEDGHYLVSTDNLTASTATAVSLRTDCDDRAEFACDVYGSPAAGASQAFLPDAVAGEYVAILVERMGDEGTGWHLSVTPIDGIADLGEACDVSTPCVNDATCTYDLAVGSCVLETAPVVTDATIVQSAYWDYRVTLTGTDPNRDVETLQVPGFADIMGDIWGDAANEPPIVLDARITWDGDTFTAVATVPQSFLNTGLGDVLDADFELIDHAGAPSGTTNLAWPAHQPNVTQSYIGDPCNMCVECVGNNNGYPLQCDPNAHPDPADGSIEIVGLQCTWNEAGTASTCEDRNINDNPVVSGGVMHWAGPDAIITVSGYDSRHETGIYANLVVHHADSTTLDLGSTYLSDITWDTGNLVATGVFNPGDLTNPIDHLELALQDKGYPIAGVSENTVTVAWVDPVAPAEVGFNEQCDLRGWDSVCDEPYVCSPTLSGIPACADSEAPELYGATGVYSGGWFTMMAFSVDASDRNADWGALMVEGTSGPSYGLEQNGWDPSPFGKQAYQGELVLTFANWMYKVWLEDADGNTSDSTVVLGVPTQADGEECNTGICSWFGCDPPVSYCDVNAGLTCDGIALACETAVAPTLSSAVVRRTGTTKYTVAFTGADDNADVNDIEVVQTDDGVVTVPYYNMDFAAPTYGYADFASSFNGTVADPFAATTVDVTLQDFAFLDSNTLTLTVPPILEPGDACSGDDTVDRCWDGAECIDGTCFAYEPQLTGAELTWENNGRDAVVTVTGFDDQTGSDAILDFATVELGGLTFEKSLSQYNTTWDGNEFSFEIDAPGVGLGALVGEQFAHVTIVDEGGFQDSASYFITTHKGWGDACDDAGIDDICHAGLSCIASTCVNDVTDTCAGVPLTVASDDVSVDTAGGTRLQNYPAYDTCGASNQPNGNEVAVQYTAAQTGTLVITTTDDPSDGNVISGYLFVRRDQCVNYDAVEACSNLSGNTNSVSIDVEAGDVLYITVDGPTWPSGGPVDLDFSYL